MRELTIERILSDKVIAIVRGLSPNALLDLAGALVAGGINLIEITFDQSNPESWIDTCVGIRMLNDEFKGKVLAGAGTVLTVEQAARAYDAGAKYLISPDANPLVIKKTRELGIVSIPGCMTPTDIASAMQAGADFIKIFPAGALGVDYIRAIRAPLSHAKMLAVGGIDEKNAADFIRAGCLGIGVGGKLVNKDLIAAKKFDQITEIAKAHVAAVSR